MKNEKYEIPDRWLIIEIEKNNKKSYKLFSTWFGGYLGSDSWRISSFIKKIRKEKKEYIIETISGTKYKIGNNIGASSYTNNILELAIKKTTYKKTKIVESIEKLEEIIKEFKKE